MENHIKKIIEQKQYFELTENEKLTIEKWAKSEEEFEALKLTFLEVYQLKSDNEQQLSPSIKARLDERFLQKHKTQKETWYNKLLLIFFPKEVSFYKKPAFQLAMVALVIALFIPLFWQKEAPRYAMNKSEIKVDKLDKLPIQQKKALDSEGIDTSSIVNSENKTKKAPVPEVQPKEKQPGHKIKTFESLEEPVQHPKDKSIAQLKKEIQQSTKGNLAEETRPKLQSEDDVHLDFSNTYEVEANQISSKKVDASETLDLLTILY